MICHGVEKNWLCQLVRYQIMDANRKAAPSTEKYSGREASVYGVVPLYTGYVTGPARNFYEENISEVRSRQPIQPG